MEYTPKTEDDKNVDLSVTDSSKSDNQYDSPSIGWF